MATATTSSTPTTQCPGCGAKIPTTVSICPYCVTPQTSATKAAEGASPVQERLQRLKEKPEYETGLAYRPMEGPRYRDAMRRARRGVAMAAVGVILAASALSGELTSAVGIVRIVAGVALLGFGLARVLPTFRVRSETLARPLLVRAARVAERRSETEIRGARGITTYFFDLEFDDGSQGEFFYPGRGPTEEPLANGVTGVAYTRGPELLAFKRIRA